MAFDYLTEYPGQIDGTDLVAYPYGKAQNITTPGDGSGTPWEKRIVNDWLGFFQAVLKDSADIVPSGAADEVGASQYLDGLKIIMGRGGVKLATANYTILKDDGFQYIHVETGGGDLDITLPVVAVNGGRRITVKMVDTGGTVTVKTESAGVTIDGVDGSVGIVLDSQYQFLEVFEANSLWNISGVKNNQYQRRVLPANITVDSFDNADLRIANLVIGKTYRVTARMHCILFATTFNSLCQLNVKHDGVIITFCLSRLDNYNGGNYIATTLATYIFKATATTLITDISVTSTPVQVVGLDTWIGIEELNNYGDITTKFTP